MEANVSENEPQCMERRCAPCWEEERKRVAPTLDDIVEDGVGDACKVSRIQYPDRAISIRPWGRGSKGTHQRPMIWTEVHQQRTYQDRGRHAPSTRRGVRRDG
jgi:hypothetical protein